jgi:hypothetical protein
MYKLLHLRVRKYVQTLITRAALPQTRENASGNLKQQAQESWFA